MLRTAKAYAKINLFLDVVGKREDGYHILDSVFQTVSLCDEIELEMTDGGISVFCDNVELCGADNIVFSACKFFFERIGYDKGVQVRVKKNIPVAAGLGGGSADAAATLRLLNEATGERLSSEQLCDLALSLGADVPFCLSGGTARVGGIGEHIKPLTTPVMHYVLLKNREKQSTGKMFSVLDNTDYVKRGSIDELCHAINDGNTVKIANNLFNAFSYCWDFDDMTACFKFFNPSAVFLSGSGPTVCALFCSEKEARICAEALSAQGESVFYACSVDSY